jgi:hypothetical protein
MTVCTNHGAQIHELRRMLQSLEAKQQERQWLKNQTIGDLDDNRLVDGTPPPPPTHIFSKREMTSR